MAFRYPACGVTSSVANGSAGPHTRLTAPLVSPPHQARRPPPRPSPCKEPPTAPRRGGVVSRRAVACSPCGTPWATQRLRAGGLPGRAALRPEQRMREACGFHGLAQRRGGALGSAVDQGPQGPREGVLPRPVEREDAPRGGQGFAEREARIPPGRDPFRLEPDIPAGAGERVLRGRAGRGLSRGSSSGHRSAAVVWTAPVGTARGYRLTERFHDQALRRWFLRPQAVWQCAEVAETQQA